MYLLNINSIFFSKVNDYDDKESTIDILELIDKDNIFNKLAFDDLPYYSIIDKVQYARDRFNKNGSLINIILDLSQI